MPGLQDNLPDTAQQRLNALRVAGRMLAPIFEAERGGSHYPISLQFTGEGVRVSQVLSQAGTNVVNAEAEALDVAFTRFRQRRGEFLCTYHSEANERAEFEAWRAERQKAAA